MSEIFRGDFMFGRGISPLLYETLDGIKYGTGELHDSKILITIQQLIYKIEVLFFYVPSPRPRP